MTKYRLDAVNYNGASTHDNITIENYLIMFKDNNNNILITDVYAVQGRIIRLEIIGLPPINNYLHQPQLNIKSIYDKVFISRDTVNFILNNTVKELGKIYGRLAQPVQEILANIQQLISSDKIALSAKTQYKYKFALPGNYTFSIDLIMNNKNNEPGELFVSLWKTLSLPLNTTYRRSTLYLHYYILNNKLYCTMFSYNPLIPRAKVIISDKLDRISINTVIDASRRILEKYLDKTGIRNYEILSMAPRWIGINEYSRNWSLIIIPNANLTLEATVKTGAEIKHYIIYLNLDTMDGFVKGEYIPVVSGGGSSQNTVADSSTGRSGSIEHIVLVVVIVVLGVIMGFYLYCLRRRMTR